MWLYVPVYLLLDFLLFSVNVSTFVSVLHSLNYTSFLLGFIRTIWVIFQNKIFYCSGGNHKKIFSLWVQIEKQRKLTPVIVILISRSVWLTLCEPVDRSTPGLPDLHRLAEFAQTPVHRVGDAIQPSHPLLPPSPHTLSLSQHQGNFPIW